MFVYWKLKGVDTKALVYEALKEKVVYVPGGEFYLDDEICDEIRFNYTHSTQGEVKIGFQRLKNIL
jgi:DNA-binding transcriptional MocR family regulator